MKDDGMPHTQDVRRTAQQTNTRGRGNNSGRGGQQQPRAGSGGGFDMDNLPEPMAETGPALYQKIGTGTNDDYTEISRDIAFAYLDGSDLRIIREKERSLAMMQDIEEAFGGGLDLSEVADPVIREISFIGHSSKGVNGFLTSAMNRQEQIQRQESTVHRGDQEQQPGGIGAKLKGLLGGGGRGRRGGRSMRDDLARELNTTMVEPQDGANDIW